MLIQLYQTIVICSQHLKLTLPLLSMKDRWTPIIEKTLFMCENKIYQILLAAPLIKILIDKHLYLYYDGQFSTNWPIPSFLCQTERIF